MTSDIQPDLSPLFWEQRYQEGRTGWDLGEPAPPFVQLLAGANAPQPGTMAVLGSGRGHDALLFADRGFDILGFDVAPSAIAAATQLAQERHLSARFQQQDIFSLETDFAGQFDYVLEHTCFCAIAPALRPAYVRLVHTLLRPHGELIALFWAHNKPSGPPFGATVAELQTLFTPYFDAIAFEPATNSVASRQHEEYLVRYRAKLSPQTNQPPLV